jgi:hypothetical protein
MLPDCESETIDFPKIDNLNYPVPNKTYESTTRINLTLSPFQISDNPYCTVVYTIALNDSTNNSSYLLNFYNSTTLGFDKNNFMTNQIYLSIYNNTNFYSNGTQKVTVIGSLFGLPDKTLNYSFYLIANNNCSGTVIYNLVKDYVYR